MTKPETVTNLKVRLWSWFSKYIRARDAKDGYCKCISCGRVHHWKDQIHAGHFIPKARGNSIYFNEKNVNAQCSYCNKWKGGNPVPYRIALNKKWGEGTDVELEKLAVAGKKFEIPELKDMIKHYREEFHKLEKTNL